MRKNKYEELVINIAELEPKISAYKSQLQEMSIVRWACPRMLLGATNGCLYATLCVCDVYASMCGCVCLCLCVCVCVCVCVYVSTCVRAGERVICGTVID